MNGPKPRAANQPYRLPPPLWHARCKACWFTTGLLVLVVASFWSLDLQWGQFFSMDAARSMGRFLAEFFPPDTSPEFMKKVALGAWETLAMSALGTVLAAGAGLALALPASRLHQDDTAWARAPTRLVLNALRSKFSLDDEELKRLLELAHDTAHTAYDYQRFTSQLNERFTQAQKVRVVEAMWQVAYADDHIDAHENHVISKVAGLLHVTHGEYIAAKMRAKEAALTGH